MASVRPRLIQAVCQNLRAGSQGYLSWHPWAFCELHGVFLCDEVCDWLSSDENPTGGRPSASGMTRGVYSEPSARVTSTKRSSSSADPVTRSCQGLQQTSQSWMSVPRTS